MKINDHGYSKQCYIWCYTKEHLEFKVNETEILGRAILYCRYSQPTEYHSVTLSAFTKGNYLIMALYGSID
jgi:hypothetical protein